MTQRLPIVAVLTLCMLTACGGPEGSDELRLPPGDAGTIPEMPEGPVYDPASATGAVAGRIVFDGTPPERQVLQMGADFYCTRNAMGTRSEDVLVTEDGLLRNVIVYVRSGYDETLVYPVPETPVVLDQERCMYRPHVLTLMAGQDLLVRNSDPTFHNVHSQSSVNTVFNFGQAMEGLENIEVFDRPEMPVIIGCDVHRWMKTFVGVFGHPFHTNSGDTGTFELAVPPGTYEIVAWHEVYGEQATTVEVSDGASIDLEFTFSAAAGL